MKKFATRNRGLWIAFFGVDGVGKSAVIDQLKARLGPAFAEVRRFHFRPRFRTRGMDGTPVTNPHAKSPRTVLVTLGKLLYWFADCWYGHLTAVLLARRNRELIVFDRYYDDILVDPARYRLPERCLQFARTLVKLAPRPDLCVLLDAPAHVVQQRKQECSLAESERQRAAYLSMFKQMDCTLLVNAESSLDEVCHSVAVGVSTFQSSVPSDSRESFSPVSL
jgi:thymidylate kinase